MSTLPPSIDEHENVISSDSQNDKNDEGMKGGIVGIPDNPLVDHGSEAEGKKDDYDADEAQEERLEMDREVNEDEHHREYRPLGVLVYDLVEFILEHLV